MQQRREVRLLMCPKAPPEAATNLSWCPSLSCDAIGRLATKTGVGRGVGPTDTASVAGYLSPECVRVSVCVLRRRDHNNFQGSFPGRSFHRLRWVKKEGLLSPRHHILYPTSGEETERKPNQNGNLPSTLRGCTRHPSWPLHHFSSHSLSGKITFSAYKGEIAGKRPALRGPPEGTA